MPKHKKHHDGMMHEGKGRSGEERHHRIMKARGKGMVTEDMNMRSNLPDHVIMHEMGNSPYHQHGELPGPYEGVESQMAETMFDFKKVFKPYK
jgi:hypothetical protein